MKLNKINGDKYFHLFGVNILTLPFTFFSINSIFSIKYEGIESSNSYTIIIITSALLFYGMLIKRVMFRKHSKKEFLVFFSAMFIILNALYVYIFKGIDTQKFIIQFLLLVMPALLYGLELSRNGNLHSISTNLFVVAIIVTLSVVTLIPKMLFIPTNELMTFFGGGHYQAFSYSVSFSFLVSIVYYFFYFQNKKLITKLFFMTLFLVQVSGVVLSGGRGGAGVAIVGLFCVLLNKFHFQRVIKIITSIIASLFIITLSLFFYFQEYSDRVIEGFARIFSIVNEGGIDFTQTSNRDLVYAETINLILKDPIFGVGIFGYLIKTDGGYPHNFFLEILLQGGILFLIMWSIFFLFFLIKLVKLIKEEKHKYLLATFIYSFVLLMFSGTYLLEPFFWFNLSYVLVSTSKLNRKKLV